MPWNDQYKGFSMMFDGVDPVAAANLCTDTRVHTLLLVHGLVSIWDQHLGRGAPTKDIRRALSHAVYGTVRGKDE
jgi:hypothetical protein